MQSGYKTVDNLRTHTEISVQNFFHTCVKFIIFPLAHEETQIQNMKCCDKCGMKLPVSAACLDETHKEHRWPCGEKNVDIWRVFF